MLSHGENGHMYKTKEKMLLGEIKIGPKDCFILYPLPKGLLF